ncbi:MAG: DUF4129 domain-containing protein [Ktedonobacteraceae bacterium]
MAPSPGQSEDANKEQQLQLAEAEKRRRQQILAMATTNVQETPSVGEIILPYLFAAMETCWIDAVFIGLASLDFFQSHNPLMPLWAPFLLIIGSQWLLAYLERRNAVSGDSTNSEDEEEKGGITVTASPGSALFVLFVTVTTLFVIWTSVYAATAFVLDARWLLALVNDILLLNGNAYHVFCIVAIALYLCWRGLRLLTRSYEPSQVFNSLRIGMGVIIAVILLRAGQEGAGVVLNDDLTLLLLVPIFLFLSLAAHALARVTFVRHTHPVGLDGDASTQERFILTLIGIIGGVLLLLSWLVDTFASASILAETRQILILVSVGYDAFVRVLATIIVFLVTPLFWLFNWWTARFPPSLPKVPKTGPQHQPPKVLHVASTTPLLVPILKILVPIVLIILAVIVIRWILRRRRRVQLIARRQREEVRESLWSWSLFWTQIKALLYALFGRFFPRKATDEHAPIESEDLPMEPAARSIREMYRLLLQRAATHGYPRKKDETPNEFKQRLHDHIPAAEPQLATVTHAYTATRYGGIVPDEAAVAHVRQEWNTLEQKWREPLPG